MPKIDLLPCPFCGKLGTLSMIYLPDEECECVCHVTCNAVIGGCGASTGWDYETPEEAAQAWNTRSSGWIPCRERLPDSPIRCAVITENGGYGVSRYMGRNMIEWSLLGEIVTHWMQLPEAPKRKDDAE